ncbi:MAG: transporter related [Pseudonocardiales bacterium]|nr:transporter related [Pseudonocardiales bacterium]
MTDQVVEVRGLRKTYGDLVAVDEVDFSVEAGEIVALLGPNGAGKTTTVEMCAGFRAPTAGVISVLGSTPFGADGHWKSRIGIVTQSAADFQEFTVNEAVSAIAGCFASPRPLAEVVEAVGLGARKDALVRTLSGGQRRRVDVALGIIGAPELLFLDEPTTGFDPEARRQFWDLILQLRTDGTTILLTTHYLDEAEHLADRVGVIARGRMIEINRPELIGNRVHGSTTVSWEEGDRVRSERTSTPTEFLRQLTARIDGEIPGLTVARPTLEDVYLQMISDSEATGR